MVIKACGKLGLWEKALELKNQITDRAPTRYVYNNLLMTLNVCNQLAPALEIKAEMEAYGVAPDGFSYFTLLLNVCNVRFSPTRSSAVKQQHDNSMPVRVTALLCVFLFLPYLW